jgi:hypothetical protein
MRTWDYGVGNELQLVTLTAPYAASSMTARRAHSSASR